LRSTLVPAPICVSRAAFRKMRREFEADSAQVV
jgi:hypothetical protein